MTERENSRTAAEDLLSYLIVEHGLTNIDPFERAHSLYTAKEVLELILKELEYAYIKTVAPLIDTGCLISEDKRYKLEAVTKSVTTVDKVKLLRNEPEIYEKIARVSPSTFVKELGHAYLRNNLIEKIGIEKVHAYDTLNIKDFNALEFLDKDTKADYRRASSHVVEYRMIKTEDSPEVSA